MDAQEIMKLSGETPEQLLERARHNVNITMIKQGPIAKIFNHKWGQVLNELSPGEYDPRKYAMYSDLAAALDKHGPSLRESLNRVANQG